jgi:hypothetical protein
MVNNEEKDMGIPDPPVTPGEGQQALCPQADSKPEFKPESAAIAVPEIEKKAVADVPQPKPKKDQPPLAKAMEVHHHPDLHHQKKPWREYLLEGFMIFIAVMMGFIAENIREDITNNEHVHQLTSQLVADLKADTARLSNVIEAQIKIRQANDSLFILLQQPLATADFTRIQQLIIKSHNLWTFHPSGGAIGAIKNELHLKQFGNSQLITYIANYESNIFCIRCRTSICNTNTICWMLSCGITSHPATSVPRSTIVQCLIRACAI